MAIARVRTATANSTTSVSTLGVPWGANPATGNFVAVVVCFQSASLITVTSVTDSQGNTYNKAVSTVYDASVTAVEIWYCESVIGGTTPTVTVNFSAANFRGVIYISEYSGIGEGATLDVTFRGSQASATSWSVGPSASTAFSNELVIAGAASNNFPTFTVGSGFGNFQTLVVTSIMTGAVEDLVAATPATQTALFTASTAAVGVVAIASFRTSSNLPQNYKHPRVGNGMSATEGIR